MLYSNKMSTDLGMYYIKTMPKDNCDLDKGLEMTKIYKKDIEKLLLIRFNETDGYLQIGSENGTK